MSDKLIATAITEKPLIIWQYWNGPTGALVRDEADVPATQYGVCPLKIVGGVLVARDSTEMAGYAAEYATAVEQLAYRQKFDALETATFTYDSLNFPMYATARLYYDYIKQNGAANYKVMSTTGQYNLASANCGAFITAYWTKINDLLAP